MSLYAIKVKAYEGFGIFDKLKSGASNLKNKVTSSVKNPVNSVKKSVDNAKQTMQYIIYGMIAIVVLLVFLIFRSR